MQTVALFRPAVQTDAERRLDAHLDHFTDMATRGQIQLAQLWQRVRDTAVATGHSPDEAEQMADRCLMGDWPV